MELTTSISLGELFVGVGTMALAIITVIITGWQLKNANRNRLLDIDRQYKLQLLRDCDQWTQDVVRALNTEAYHAKEWFTGTEQQYFDTKAELLEKLLHHADMGWYLGEKGQECFKKYSFKTIFDQMFSKYHECTDILHDVVNPKSKIKTQEKASECEIDLLNNVNHFVKLITTIRKDEQIY